MEKEVPSHEILHVRGGVGAHIGVSATFGQVVPESQLHIARCNWVRNED